LARVVAFSPHDTIEEAEPMLNSAIVWGRIISCAGKTFHTKTGIEFTYDRGSSFVKLNNTDRNIPMSDFMRALSLVPLPNVAAVQRMGVQGPAYLYAILMDQRIRQTDW
jgi:hypothetical protein